MVPIPKNRRKWTRWWVDSDSDFWAEKRRKKPLPPSTASSTPTEIEPSPYGLPMFVITMEVRDASGNPITVRGATKAMISGSYDLRELVLDPGSRRRQAIDNSAVPGFVTTSFGEIELINAGAPGPFDEWVNYATNGGKVTCEFGWYGDIYPYQFRVVYIAYIIGRPQFNDGVMRLSIGGREWLFDSKIVKTGFSDDTGSENGVDLEIAGLPGSQVKQILCGTPWYFKPILTNDLENVWFVCDNPITAGSLRAFDGGVELTRSGGIGTGQGGGSFRVLERANGAVFIQPVTDIRFELRVSATGLKADPTSSPHSWTICDLAERAGVTGIDPTNMPSGSVNFSAGNHVFRDQSYKEIFDDVGRRQIATIFFNRLNQFSAREMTPSFEGSSVYTFRDSGTWGDGNITNLTVAAIPGIEKRKWRVRVRAGKSEKSSLAGAVADGSIAPEMRDALSRDPYVVDFTGNITYNSGLPFFQASTILDKDPTADDGDVTISSVEFDDLDSMIAYAGKYMALYGSHHFGMSFEAPFNFDTMAIELLDKITLETARYGGNRQALVWLIDERLRDHKIFFGVWCHRESDAPDSSLVSIAKNDSLATGSGGSGTGSGAAGRGDAAPQLENAYINLTDKTSALVTGVSAQRFKAPYDGYIDASTYAGVDTKLTSGSLVIDMKVNGVSVMSTKFTVDSNKDSTIESTTQPVFSTTSFSRGDIFTFHHDSVGSGGKGSYVSLVMRQR